MCLFRNTGNGHIISELIFTFVIFHFVANEEPNMLIMLKMRSEERARVCCLLSNL